MSRSAAATDRSYRTRRSVAVPAGPRRVSGPLNPQRTPRARVDARTLNLPQEDTRRRAVGTRPPLRIAAEGGLTLASAVAGVALDVSHSRLMDRLVRSRGWIVIVAFGLIGIVAMQVSLLKLNAGIGRAVETITSLERSNASARSEVSRLSSGDRILSRAGVRGFVMPAPADVTFLKAGSLRSDGFHAAKRMQAPDLAIAGPAGSAIVPETLAGITGPADPAAPGTAAGADAPAPGTTTPTPANAARGTTAPVEGVPATAAPVAAAPAAPVAQPPAGTAAPATSPSGGVAPQAATAPVAP